MLTLINSGILFAQLGNDSSATRFIEYLDDELVEDIRKATGKPDLDIVGSMKYEQLKEATIESIIQEALKG